MLYYLIILIKRKVITSDNSIFTSNQNVVLDNNVNEDIELDDISLYIDNNDVGHKGLNNIKNMDVNRNMNTVNKIVKKRIRQLESDKDKSLVPYSGGYTSYLKDFVLLGKLDELMSEDILISRINTVLMIRLEKNKIYSLLVNLFYFEKGVGFGTSPMKSIIISKDSNTMLIARIIVNAIIRASNEYDIIGSECDVHVLWR